MPVVAAVVMCKKCGFEIRSDWKFCPNCGNKVMKPKDAEVGSGDEEVKQVHEDSDPTLSEAMDLDRMINSATGVEDSVMLNRGKN